MSDRPQGISVEAGAASGSAATTRVGLIGLGSIGQSLVDLVKRDPTSPLVVVGALVRDAARHAADGPTVVESLDDLLRLQPDVIAEAAGHAAVREFGPMCLQASLPLVMLSVGALADPDFEQQIRRSAVQGNVAAEIPSGGVGGLDVIASAANGVIDRVIHAIVKPPRSLDVEVESRTEIFSGSAREAAIRYPQNANVAAAVALAGIGLDRSEVVIAADPNATTNRHEIEVVGEFGCAKIMVDNKPSRLNPRTAAIVAMSLKHTLEKRRAPIVVG